jgi:hypothetical protein
MKWVRLVVLALFCLGVGKGLYFFREGFTLRRIQGWDRGLSVSFDEEADRALSQRYYYLGRGRQCFAFESEDQRYVLKFPRTDTHRLAFWQRVLPGGGEKQVLKTAARKRVQESLELAYEELKNPSALVAIHLGPTAETGRMLELRDSLGMRHRVPLERSSFVLQYKKPILMTAFLDALKQGDRALARKILAAFVEAVRERGERQISYRDERFIDNYGFDGKRAYHIDIGSYYKGPSPLQSSEDTLRPVRKWLAQVDPQMIEVLD